MWGNEGKSILFTMITADFNGRLADFLYTFRLHLPLGYLKNEPPRPRVIISILSLWRYKSNP